MSDLFDVAVSKRPKPLADQLRPQTLNDIVGQGHLLNKGEEFRRRVESGQIGTVVLFGPPGIGKTTIARAIANSVNKEFRPLNAISSGVTEVRNIISEAKTKDILAFVDEAHRFSKNQQESLLEAAETGLFDLILATTENPAHNIVSGLLSRARVFTLKKLTEPDIRTLIAKAIGYYRQEGIVAILDEDAVQRIVAIANGDGRQTMNVMESLLVKREPGTIQVTREMVDKAFGDTPVLFDKDGDMHYNVTSAFCKSMRGGDEDGTLLWLAVMIQGGVDPMYIARRIFIHASEDVGLADNAAIATAHAAMYAVERIGMPEAAITLAHAALHVCRSPKSNSSYRGIHAALDFVKQNGIPSVPKHLADTHYKGAAALGNVGYRFPHDDPRGWVEQAYMPPGLSTGVFYQSDARDNPTFEQRADGFWDKVRNRLTPARFRR